MISHRTNRATVAPTSQECPGCAALRAEFLRFGEQVRRELALLKLNAESADIDGSPRLEGNWVTVKAAAGASGYTESGIWAKVNRGEIRKWKRGGRVFVDVGALLQKNKKTSCVFPQTVASMTTHLEESKGIGIDGKERPAEAFAHSSRRG